jgi:RNA polymerase sigma-70 factor (ECF subfamily)
MALRVSWKKYDDQSDETLVKRFTEEGSLEVLGILYKRYMHLVLGVCMKYFEDREEAQDGVMAIFEKLITELPRHSIENFKSWLYVLTKNFCLMEIRSGKSREKRMKAWQEEQSTFVESETVLHPIDEEEPSLNKILEECIRELKEEQKQCIELFYYRNKSYKEIAQQMKADEKKVKSLIQNGKRNLKICIERKDGKEE